jgi:two-component system alkaline phosphatase synthesis response regulator PhoP
MISAESKGTILVVEDEPNLGITLKEYLETINYRAYLAQSISEAKKVFHDIAPQVVLMDIGLPDGSGLELAKELRQGSTDFLLFFLSAQNDPDTKLEALEIGAEDYITKPFALKELTIRLKRAFQLHKDFIQKDDCLQHGPLKIWFSRFQVSDALGTVLNIGQKEAAILNLLYEGQGQVFEREQIIDAVWGENKFPSNRTVDNYIVRLRKWCETDQDKNIEIQSIRGIGYKLVIKGN